MHPIYAVFLDIDICTFGLTCQGHFIMNFHVFKFCIVFFTGSLNQGSVTLDRRSIIAVGVPTTLSTAVVANVKHKSLP